METALPALRAPVLSYGAQILRPQVHGTGPHRVLRIKGGFRSLREAGVILSSLFVIGSIPALPSMLWWLLRRALRTDKDKDEEEQSKQRRRRLVVFAAALAAYAMLVLRPIKQTTQLLQGRLWDWWLEYLSIHVAYRGGKPLADRNYFYALMPHGLYPFGGACACISRMVDIFPNMRPAVAPAALRVPVLRHLMGWIGCVPVEKQAMRAILRMGASVGLVPGGIAEMLRTDWDCERVVLKSRKGFIQMALEEGVPIVPVYIFGTSTLCSNLQLPLMERLSRWLRISLVLPYGRFGLLVPRRVPLLYAIGEAIECPGINGKPTAAQVDDTHQRFLAAVEELYNFYKGCYGWQDRAIHVE